MFTSQVIINTECQSCLNAFLQMVSFQFPEFVQYYDEKLFFESDVDAALQTMVDNFSCSIAEEEINSAIESDQDVIKFDRDPTINENPTDNFLWLNTKTGDLFSCLDKTQDANIWVTTDKSIIVRPIPQADKFDFFGDDQCIAYYNLNGNATDSGGKYPGKADKINWVSLFDHKVADSSKKGIIDINNLPFDENTEAVTIAAWIYWDGASRVMLFDWGGYNIYCLNGYIGFNTKRLQGTDFKDYKKKWTYGIFTFRKNLLGRMFLNGAEQTMYYDNGAFETDDAVLSSSLRIFGRQRSSQYRKFGRMGRVRIFNGELTPTQVAMLTMAEVDLIRSVGGDV